MNSLSWMLYWAGVANGAIAFCIMAGAVLIFASAPTFFETKYKRAAVALFVVGALLELTAVFIPSKDTIYAIAASEMGEEALKTPEASKARQALNAWLDKQIDEKPEASK